MYTSFSFYNENSAKNAALLTINSVRFYFSYSTCVAVQFSSGTIVRQNEWSTTTGKHLNWIDGGNKKARVTKETFALWVAVAMEEAGITELPTINI